MKVKTLIISICMLMLCSCATTPPAQPPIFRFNYVTLKSSPGVIRAVDDFKVTIVQFVSIERSKPVFLDIYGQKIPFHVEGQYAVFPAIIPHFSVKTEQGIAVFEYQANEPLSNPVSPDSPKEELPSEPVTQKIETNKIDSAPLS